MAGGLVTALKESCVFRLDTCPLHGAVGNPVHGRHDQGEAKKPQPGIFELKAIDGKELQKPHPKRCNKLAGGWDPDKPCNIHSVDQPDHQHTQQAKQDLQPGDQGSEAELVNGRFRHQERPQ